MTRFLQSVLGAKEPLFSQSIRQLEQAAGLPSADIRLTSEISQQVRAKIAQLGLDPNDTTSEELYTALHQRLAADEQKVRSVLGIGSVAPAEDVVTRVLQHMQQADMAKQCFALKISTAKRLLKKKPPKHAMKQLGYRSIDSMLKHESPALMLAAAMLSESAAWQKGFRDQYAKLAPSDFESRPIALIQPTHKRWQQLSKDFASRQRHMLLGLPELGAVVVLPPTGEQIDGLAITILLLVTEEMNAIRSYSSFVKLQQVKPDFGNIVQQVSVSEPITSATLAGQPVSWRMIQRFYTRFDDAYHPEVFEPHVQKDDLTWNYGEHVLAALDAQLDFWHGTQFLAFLQQDQAVSLNLLDVALGYCNKLPFADRVIHFVRDNLWHELMMRYLHQQNLETAVHSQLSQTLTDAQEQEVAL